MIIRVNRLTPSEWSNFSENAHKIVFGETRDVSVDRIDFALVVENEKGIPMGYITCRELDAKSLYWQYGGAFPGTRKTSLSFPAYQKCLRWCSQFYDRVSTVVENNNYVMLKMHLISGFRINGFRVFSGHGLVELTKEFKNAGGA